MDFRAEIARAEREVAEARAEHERAALRLEGAARKLGGLISVYHGISALETSAHAQSATQAPSHTESQERQRAPKGEARRRANHMLVRALPSGLTKDAMLKQANDEGAPIAEGTLRRALAQLAEEGRARSQDDLWYAVESGVTGDQTETAGASHSHPAVSLSEAKEDEHETALAEMLN